MNQRLKERLVGAAVLVVIAVIFIPMILTGPIDTGDITKTNIPEPPDQKFSSKLIPLNESLKPVTTAGQTDSAKSVTGENTSEMTADPETEKVQDKVEVVTDAKAISDSPVATVNTAKNKQVGLTAWVVQLGSFESRENAESLNQKLRKAGFPAFVEPLTQNKKTAYRVRVGPELLHADADKLLDKINKKMKLKGIVLSYP